MKNIVVASGKGGTGKTTISVNLAYYLSNFENKRVKLLDCDVEAPNCNLFVKAKFDESSKVTVLKPSWGEDECISCGKCVSICNYNAIAKVKNKILIFDELCHSCGACGYLCPENALKMKQIPLGKVELAENNLPFSFGHGILNIGESLAPKVIEKLKEKMEKDVINIIDASPGTTCPVVKSMENMDYCLLVTEPTPFGLNDLALATSLTAKLGIPSSIIINRSYGDDKIIEDFASKHQVPIVGKIPFDVKYAQSYSNGDILIESNPELKEVFSEIYNQMKSKSAIPTIKADQEEKINKQEFIEEEHDVNNSSVYKEVVVISGKGGTGKTTITSALSELMDNKVIADTDVDASNLHLLCGHVNIQTDDFIGGKKYSIDHNKCSGCGLCNNLCHFGAVKQSSADKSKYEIDKTLCEGCGFCFHVCRAKAISSKDSICGVWKISKTNQGYLSHAKLGIAEENSGKLVNQVRNNSATLARDHNVNRVLGDGPPGTGCPVISSITGADLALIITEPTLSGIHDMKRALNLTKHLNVKPLVVINKYDLNKNISNKIISSVAEYGSKVIGKIPFDKNVHNALMNGKSIISHGRGDAYKSILKLWEILEGELL